MKIKNISKSIELSTPTWIRNAHAVKAYFMVLPKLEVGEMGERSPNK